MNPSWPFAQLAAIFILASGSVTQAQEEPPELRQARVSYQRDIDFATRPIRDRYLSKLDALKRSLGSRGDARAAAAIQDEIDNVKASAAAPNSVARLAGIWSITYKPTGTRRYRITPDGTLKYEEGNGVANAPLRELKIFMDGDDFLVDHGTEFWKDCPSRARHFSPRFFHPNLSIPKAVRISKAQASFCRIPIVRKNMSPSQVTQDWLAKKSCGINFAG